jgi:hypothetical protein
VPSADVRDDARSGVRAAVLDDHNLDEIRWILLCSYRVEATAQEIGPLVGRDDDAD